MNRIRDDLHMDAATLSHQIRRIGIIEGDQFLLPYLDLVTGQGPKEKDISDRSPKRGWPPFRKLQHLWTSHDGSLFTDFKPILCPEFDEGVICGDAMKSATNLVASLL